MTLIVHASTPLRPSEDRARVEKALRTFFPEANVHPEGERLLATSGSLKTFRDLVWKNKILDAARRVLLGSLRSGGREASFKLNKQAAYAGTVSFAVAQAPLGDIDVHVEGDDLEALFKEIAPPTLRGRPVSEEEFERHLEKQRRARKGVATSAVPEVDLEAELADIHRPKGGEEE